ncbi:uncharacterized protein LOC133125202 isoform X1 [Conger conger]|uniref:uncharacterized protein LOC133125202 isoform X1 n=2 Tax=Conger conger TaxID=82655 RepID=UPI002A5A346D|nr:uncharacterized protein LOC133125202 isoform X1 [Conger conger]
MGPVIFYIHIARSKNQHVAPVLKMRPIFPFISKLFIFIVGIAAFASESVLTMAIVTAMHDAALSCKLTHHKQVVQVTWKKITLNSIENVASFSRFGAKISKPFQDHVQFLEHGLHKSSLLIKGVRRDNEACYKCTFYSFSDEAISSTACLKVEERKEPVTEVRKALSRDDRILHTLSCSDGASKFLGHMHNDSPVGSSVGRFDPSSDLSVSVIKASVVDDRNLICVVHPPPEVKGKDVSMVKGEPQMMFLSNRNGRLSPTLGFVILVTGLGIYNS